MQCDTLKAQQKRTGVVSSGSSDDCALKDLVLPALSRARQCRRCGSGYQSRSISGQTQ